MTTYDTEVLADTWPLLAAEHGVSDTYTALGAEAAAITVLLEEIPAPDLFVPAGEQTARRARISGRPADIASPARGDTHVIGGVTWVTDEVEERTPLVVCLCEARTQVRIGTRSE